MTYMSVYPAISIDFLYNITRDWTTYINFSKNWHPMAAMGGGGDAELKMVNLNKVKIYYFILLNFIDTCLYEEK